MFIIVQNEHTHVVLHYSPLNTDHHAVGEKISTLNRKGGVKGHSLDMIYINKTYMRNTNTYI